MIFVPKEGKKFRDVLDAAGLQQVFKFSESTILPQEQKDALMVVLNHNRNKNKYNNSHKDENSLKNQLASMIIQKVQDPRLTNKGKINSLILSTGGSKTTGDTSENATLLRTGSKVMYTVIEINDIVVIEPIGQPGNATYIALQQEGLEECLQKNGREAVLGSDMIFKVAHDISEDTSKIGLYDYSANHLIDILEYMIDKPQELIAALKNVKGQQKYCSLKTLVSYMPSTSAAIIQNVQQAAQEYGITASEVVAYSAISSEKETTELKGTADVLNPSIDENGPEL